MGPPPAQVAEVVCEYGPFPGVDHVHGVTYDGRWVWLGAGDALLALDPTSGRVRRSIEVTADAGVAFDGRHLFQLAGDRIQKIDPETGRWRQLRPRLGRGEALGRSVPGAEDPSGRPRDRGHPPQHRVRPLRH